MNCKRCNRPLKTKESKERGYGKVCAKKEGILKPKMRTYKKKLHIQNDSNLFKDFGGK